MIEPAYDRLLRDLAEAEVQFVVIGALALGAWGVVRATKDVDVVVARNEENAKRLAKVAVDAGGRVHEAESLIGSEMGIAGLLMSGEQVMIETRFGNLDVVGGFDAVPSYEELAARAVETEVLGVSVRVCSIDDLRAMKRAAGRHRDLADLEDLEASEG